MRLKTPASGTASSSAAVASARIIVIIGRGVITSATLTSSSRSRASAPSTFHASAMAASLLPTSGRFFAERTELITIRS